MKQMAKTAKKILLLGDTGKMGSAIRLAFAADHEIVGLNREHFDAANLDQVAGIVERERPDLVINTVAFLGIDACERDPAMALQLNAMLPKRLAALSREHRFILIHFSSDAVFGDVVDHRCLESDPVDPFNVYALTKYGGDCFVRAAAERYYVFRLPVLFGQSTRGDQFVEKMLARARAGARRLEVSMDVVSTPSYSCDVAMEVRRIVEEGLAPGLYHIANEGRGSLYEMISLLVAELKLSAAVEPVSHEKFPSLGRKNTYTMMGSEKVAPLRPWRVAFREYCAALAHTLEPSEAARERQRGPVRGNGVFAGGGPGTGGSV